MPLVSYIFGGLDFSSYFVRLGPIPEGYAGSMSNYAELKDAGVALWGYGQFATVVVNFLILAFIIFLLVRTVNRLNVKDPETEANEPSSPPEDITLLKQIRDELAARRTRPAEPRTSGGQSGDHLVELLQRRIAQHQLAALALVAQAGARPVLSAIRTSSAAMSGSASRARVLRAGTSTRCAHLSASRAVSPSSTIRAASPSALAHRTARGHAHAQSAVIDHLDDAVGQVEQAHGLATWLRDLPTRSATAACVWLYWCRSGGDSRAPLRSPTGPGAGYSRSAPAHRLRRR